MCESISNGDSNTRLHPNEGGVKDNESAETTHSLMTPDQFYVADSSDASREESHAGARKVDLAARPTPKPAAIGDRNADKQITSVVIGTTPDGSRESELQSPTETESSEFESDASFSKNEAVLDFRMKAVRESEPGKGEPIPGLITKHASGDNSDFAAGNECIAPESEPDPLDPAPVLATPGSKQGPSEHNGLAESVEQADAAKGDETSSQPEAVQAAQSPPEAPMAPAAPPPTPAVADVEASPAPPAPPGRVPSRRLCRRRGCPCPREHLFSERPLLLNQVISARTGPVKRMYREIKQQYWNWTQLEEPADLDIRISGKALLLASEQFRAAGKQLHMQHEDLYGQLPQRILMLAMMDNKRVHDGVSHAIYDCSGGVIHDGHVARATALIIEENARCRECWETLMHAIDQPGSALCAHCKIRFEYDMYLILFSPRNARWLQLVALDERSSRLVARCPCCSSLIDYLEVPHLMRAMFFGYVLRSSMSDRPD